MRRPTKPQGQHLLSLRGHLKLSQTQFGALVGLGQPAVSVWERPENREQFLPRQLATRFMEAWDCFAEGPLQGGYTEMMAVLAAHRARKAPPAAPPGREMVRMVPEKAVPGESPEIYWVPGEPSSPHGEEAEHAGPETSSDHPQGASTSLDAQEREREIMRLHLSFMTLSIFFGIWSRTQIWKRKGYRFGRWATAVVSVALLLTPTGCFRETWHDVPGPFMGALSSSKAEPRQMGEKATERWIPREPLPGQKLAPCDTDIGEEAFEGACWQWIANVAPPCSRLYRRGDRCYRPIAADPKVPVGEEPQPSRTDSTLGKSASAPPRTPTTPRRR